MKSTFAFALAILLASPSFAGILDGLPPDPVKRARPGGYNEQVKNLKSMASCSASWPVRDEFGNITGYICP